MQAPKAPDVKVLTPQTTAALNEEVQAGDRLPYVFFAMDEQDWISLGQWQRQVLFYIEQLRAVVEFYRADPEEQ